MSFLVGILEGGIHLIYVCKDGNKEETKRFTNTLPETNSSHLPKNHVKRNLFFQAAFFRCYVSFREDILGGEKLGWGMVHLNSS